MVRYVEDMAYVTSLVEGGTEAWEKFYSKNRKKIAFFLFCKYTELGSADIEEVCDNVQIRLTKDDNKALRQYRGECSFESYIVTATNWAVKDWFKANSLRLQQISFDDGINSENKLYTDDPLSQDSDASARIKSLPDDLRQAFLLRYHEDFGFPPEEIRLLAKRTGRQIREITEALIRCFSPEGENLLTKRRQEKNTLEASLQRCSSGMSMLKRTEEKLSKKMDNCHNKKEHNEIENELNEVMVKVRALERRRELLAKQVCVPIKTPYELIAEIMNIDRVSTVRGWVKKAKGLLEKSLRKKPMQM